MLFQYRIEPLAPVTKFVPLTVSVNAVLSAPIDDGESEVIVGTTGATVKTTAFEIPAEPGSWTATRNVPGVVK